MSGENVFLPGVIISEGRRVVDCGEQNFSIFKRSSGLFSSLLIRFSGFTDFSISSPMAASAWRNFLKRERTEALIVCGRELQNARVPVGDFFLESQFKEWRRKL